jgi:predicted nucleic acid-binding protein
VTGVQSFYLDASALAKRYAPEVGTPVVNHLFARAPADRLYLFNIGIAEVVSVPVRKRNAGNLSAAAFTQALTELGTEIVSSAAVHKMTADERLVTAALPLIDTHSINATDAIVLRSALDIALALRATGDDLVLVASDQRLLRAAQGEGLTTLDPETQDQTALDTLLHP